MKSQSLAVLALIGQVSAVEVAKQQYWASADDFEDPSDLYQNMAQAKAVANVDEFDEQSEMPVEKSADIPKSSSDKKAQSLTQTQTKDDALFQKFKGIGKEIEAKKEEEALKDKQEAEDKKTKEEQDARDEKATNSFDGLVHADNGKLMFPDGSVVGAVNNGNYAQVKSKDTNDLLDEVKGKMANEKSLKKETAAKEKEEKDKQQKDKEQEEFMKKVNPHDGLVHTEDGERLMAPEKIPIAGANVHAQTSSEEKLETKATSFNKLSEDEQVEAVTGGADLIQKAKGEADVKLKKVAKEVDEKKKQAIVEKARKQNEEFKNSINKFDGLVHSADGSVKDQEGNEVSGANSMSQVSSSSKSKTKSKDDDDSEAEKEEKANMISDMKKESAKFQKNLADKEAKEKAEAKAAAAIKKKDDDDTAKELKLNKFDGLFHNEDGTKQFKGVGKGVAAGFVGGANDWHQSKSTVVAEGQSVKSIEEGHKSHHHKHKGHAKHSQHEKKAEKKVEKKVAKKTEKVHTKKHHHSKHHTKTE